MRRTSLLAVPVLVALVVSVAAAAPEQPEALATAVISRVVQPGLPDQISLSLAAPPPVDQTVSRLRVPRGRLDRTDRAPPTAGVAAQPGVSSSAQANVARSVGLALRR